ncbi:MAG: nucleotide-binding protein [bacterium]|nr:nucleotide-binding protein [bacterium]
MGVIEDINKAKDIIRRHLQTVSNSDTVGWNFDPGNVIFDPLKSSGQDVSSLVKAFRILKEENKFRDSSNSGNVELTLEGFNWIHNDGSSVGKKKCFVVHGANILILNEVKDLLKNLPLELIILYDQPGLATTVIEKFEGNADVEFALILMTSDDVGGIDKDHLKTRARQNVILELGYFIGRLGRGKLCVLYHDGVEMPSDINGLVYIPLDHAGSWKGKLINELRAVGLIV